MICVGSGIFIRDSANTAAKRARDVAGFHSPAMKASVFSNAPSVNDGNPTFCNI